MRGGAGVGVKGAARLREDRRGQQEQRKEQQEGGLCYFAGSWALVQWEEE